MIHIIRCDSSNKDFQTLVNQLDRVLATLDGDDHPFYHQFNSIVNLQNTVVIYKNNIAVGCGAIKPYADQIAEVKRMFVRPEYRKQGMAAAILKELESWAKELGIQKLVLETGRKQIEAIALYTKHDYEICENFEPYIGIENSICFEKKLS
ncbi:MAG TPA: GNAT family N-acetyltransferase [Bacteroidia bacterium]|nr:GNAT family N-acetyltransferase [Bacteroidia bacterium]